MEVTAEKRRLGITVRVHTLHPTLQWLMRTTLVVERERETEIKILDTTFH